MAEQPQYTLPPPVLHEHAYLYAIVLELQRIRTMLEQNAAQQQEVEVDLREPEPPKTKPKRG